MGKMTEKPLFPAIYNLTIAGLPEQLLVSHHELETVHMPLLTELFTDAAMRPRKRHIVFLAGPAGSGKSSLAALWQEIASEITTDIPIQVLPMDGFHHTNDYLNIRTIVRDDETIPMQKVKGTPETFNLEGITQAISLLAAGETMKWPIYDRAVVKDVVPDAMEVFPHGLIIVEGNYLLLNEPGWRDLRGYANKTILIDIPEERIAEDIVKRHIAGGDSQENAKAHYLFSDSKNNDRIRANLLPPDIKLITSINREINLVK